MKSLSLKICRIACVNESRKGKKHIQPQWYCQQRYRCISFHHLPNRYCSSHKPKASQAPFDQILTARSPFPFPPFHMQHPLLYRFLQKYFIDFCQYNKKEALFSHYGIYRLFSGTFCPKNYVFVENIPLPDSSILSIFRQLLKTQFLFRITPSLLKSF